MAGASHGQLHKSHLTPPCRQSFTCEVAASHLVSPSRLQVARQSYILEVSHIHLCDWCRSLIIALPTSTSANTPAEGNQRFHLRTHKRRRLKQSISKPVCQQNVWLPASRSVIFDPGLGIIDILTFEIKQDRTPWFVRVCFCWLKVLNSAVRCFFPAAGSVSKLHMKCRNGLYPLTSIQRFTVPDDRVSWDVAFPEYSPVRYTADVVANRPVWADPDFE